MPGMKGKPTAAATSRLAANPLGDLRQAATAASGATIESAPTRANLKLLALCACLLVTAPGCICVALFRPTTPVLHKPTCDLGPVLALRLPEQINNLTGIPRTESIVHDGFNKLLGQQEAGRQDDRRELFYLRKGESWKEGAIEYTFELFHTDDAATQHYQWEKTNHRVFREATENGLNGCVYYTEQPRADPEGGSGPMSYYISRADFRLRSLYVRVQTQGNQKPPNDRLADAVRELADLLNATLVTTNQPQR